MNEDINDYLDTIESYEKISEYQEFHIIKNNNIFKFTIIKKHNIIIIKYNNYHYQFNNYDLSQLTKSIFDTIDKAYEFIIDIFEENKVIINDLIKYKSLKLLLRPNNNIQNFELVLLYNKNNQN